MGTTINIVVMLVAVLGLLTGLAGLGLYWQERQRARRQKVQRRLPQQWPLNPRVLVNSAERQVWHWLERVFPEHHVMVKLPVTRFTAPRQMSSAHEWFDLLNGAYCTFTICNAQGRAIGCIDLIGPQGLSPGNRQLKQTLLTQCGIGYIAMAPDALLATHALRASFLDPYGPDVNDLLTTKPGSRLEKAAMQLHHALARKRSRRGPDTNGAPVANDGAFVPSNNVYQPQPDSFLASLDSRKGQLVETER